MFEPILTEEISIAHFHDFLRRYLLSPERGAVAAFGDNENGIFCPQTIHDQIVSSHSLKQRVLYIHHYAILAGHHGGSKLYQSI